MAAVTPHLEQQDDPSETRAEKEYSREGTFAQKVERAEGLGDYDELVSFPLTEKGGHALQASHAELTRLAYSRKIILEQLRHRTFEVVVESRNVVLRLDEAVTGPEWNRAGAGNIRNIKLLSWTKKMGCPSFSLPAGAPQLGGTCPGAIGGQSVVPQKSLLAAQERIYKITGKPVSLPDATCERCYATGGNYYYGSQLTAQTIRDLWARQAMKDGTFVDTMSWAIENANYMLEGGTVEKANYDPERHPGRYFRIHDSGDFFNPEYLETWKHVTENFRTGADRIEFWAPTRVWATDWGAAAIKKHGGDNFIIRPSSYHVNEDAAKVMQGGAAWSVCWNKTVKDRTLDFPRASQTGGSGVPSVKRSHGEGEPFTWDCQAYAVKDEAHSCRNARGPVQTGAGPHGDLGCRACWVQPKLSVNYTEH
jgi:hypothetical protein